MTNRQIAELAIGILALYLLSLGFMSASFLSLVAVWEAGEGELLASAIPTLVYFAIAWLLWWQREELAARLFPESDEGRVPVRVAVLAVRLIGILFIARIAEGLWRTLLAFMGESIVPLRGGPILSLAASTTIALVLMFRSGAIVRFMTGSSDEGEAAAGARVAFGAVGLYLVATSIPDVVTRWMAIRDRLFLSPGPLMPHLGQIVGDLLVAGLGLALFFGAGFVARAWRSIHSMPPSQ